MTEINFTLPDQEHRRFRDCLFATQERLGVTELTHDEFLGMLLDVWQLHVEREGLEPRADRYADEQVVADGAGYVLVRPSRTRSDHVFHHLDPDDPDTPRCRDSAGGTTARRYQRRDPSTLDDRYELCSYCDPDWSPTRGSDDMESYQTLADADSLDDLRADGGQVSVDADVFEETLQELHGIADDLHGSGLEVSGQAIAERADRLDAAAGQEVDDVE